MADDDPPPAAAADPNSGNNETALHDSIRDGLDLKAIRSIVEANPQLLRQRSKSGKLPLHAAIRHRSPPSVTRYLLRKWPDSVRECEDSSSRDLPAHVVCREGRRWGSSVVNLPTTAALVVEAWPEALLQRNDHGYLPLHVARNLSLIRYLVQQRPESILDGDSDRGMTVLHLAVERGYDLPVVEFLMETCPQLVHTRDKLGRRPLHCISEETHLKAIEFLAEHDPDSLHALDNDGHTPLHCAVDNEGYVDVDIVQYLVEQAPETVRIRSTKNGSLPVHLAIQTIEDDPHDELGTVRILVEAWPESLLVATADDGLVPVHCAAQRAKFPHVRYLVEECPESVRVKTSKGWLVLHLVLELNCVELGQEVQEMYETAQFLMDEFPQSVLEPTNEGYLPLHVAAMTGYGFQEGDDNDEVQREMEFIRDLVNRAPMAVRVASEALHFPFQSAITNGHLSVPALRFLAEQYPAALRQLDDEHDGQTLMHMAVSRDHPRLNYVILLAELRPELLQTKDRNGSTPLHTAASQVQSFLDVLSGWSDVGSFYRDSGEGKRRKLLFMVRYLVEQRPQSLMEADHQGYVPLHVAVSRIVPDLNMVKLMVEAKPEALLAADHTGSLPLHVAVALDETTPVLEEFLAANIRCNQEDDPAALAVRGHQDRRDNARTFELVQLLVEPSPRSVRRKNKDGMLPLFVAAANDAPIDVLFYLATTWPEAIYGSRHGGRRRCHCLLSLQNADDTLYRTSQRVQRS